MLIRILLRTENPAQRRRMLQLLDLSNVVVSESYSADPGGLWEALAEEVPDLVLAAPSALPTPLPVTIKSIRSLPERPELILLQPSDHAEQRAQLVSAGAMAVLSLGLTDIPLGEALRALVERRRESLLNRQRAASPQANRLSDFASNSPAMVKLIDTATRVAGSDTSLLILGETGVGKEWLARAIHAEGRRSSFPFKAVNCAALSESLLESELFGHEKGAFTGAVRARRGHFEMAHQGTIFLDEVAEIPLHLQAKLLRVLQERKIQRIGAEKELEVDVRIMAATNQDLQAAVERRTFRPDLYYRLAVVTLTVPPLRDRQEDISSLAVTYVKHFAQQMGRNVEGISDDAMEALVSHRWPGNVRELINALERAVLLSRDRQITLFDLPEGMVSSSRAVLLGGEAGRPTSLPPDWNIRSLREVRQRAAEAAERSYLTEVLRLTGGRIGETASWAGITPRALHFKMRKLRLRKEDFRPSVD